MNNIVDNISNCRNDQQHERTTEIVVTNDPIVTLKSTEENLQVHNNNNDNKEKRKPLLTKEEIINVQLLGKPLVSRGPYTFYSAFAYREHGDVKSQKKQKWKRGFNHNITATKSCDSSYCHNDDDMCTCDIESCPKWSVVHMNHFYAVCPWYSKQNSNDRQKLWQHQKHSSKLTSTTAKQQSVACIAELELLWRDDRISVSNIIPSSTSSYKKRGKVVPSSLTTLNGECYGRNMMTSSNINHVASSDDENEGNFANNNDNNLNKLLLPHRRMLPRRKRQPSTKKLEAAESFAVAAAENTHASYCYNQLSEIPLNSTSVSILPSLSSNQYKHGNVLCSVRLYVMPDQTATGRVGGVHGEDEVLEINTWDTCAEDSWPNNTFTNGIRTNYSDGIDDCNYINSSSGLVLRVEDFVEWIRGGLMNNNNYENENSESSRELLESECIDNSLNVRNIKKEPPEKEFEQPNLSPLVTNIKSEVKQLPTFSTYDNKNKSKFKSNFTANVIEKTEKQNTNNNFYSKSVVEEAVEMEHASLAAALIHKVNVGKNCHFKLVNDTTAINHYHSHHELKKNHKQKLVIMSYSRYCRYRANLQRRRDEQLNERDTKNTIRVLFCRDTYDYPAELFLEPFNSQNFAQRNTAVLVNHMAPKLKGWPAHPASWMSFRWNRMRHLERGNNDNNDRRRSHQRQMLKKKYQHQNLTSGIMGCSSSSGDNSDSDRTSATNDGTNTTITTTSDSDGAPSLVISKTTNKNHSSIINVNDVVHYNNKNIISVPPTSNMIVVNSNTTDINKRLSLIRQPVQQPTKRRRVVYSTKSEQPNQHLQLNKHKKQTICSFDRQLSTSLSKIQLPTKIIHNLPPSVSIRPINSNINIQQQFYDNVLQNSQKQHTCIVSSQCQNINNEQRTSLPPVIIEYDDDSNKKKYGSDEIGHFNKSPATISDVRQRHIHEYHEIKNDCRQEQYEEKEKQRRWLVDALRLGGLEVTAVPLNISGNNNNNNKDSTVTVTSQNYLRRRHCGVSFELLSSTKNEKSHNSDLNLNKDSDSVLMTVTPDVCLLNKPCQQQVQRPQFQPKLSEGVSISTASVLQHRAMHIRNKNSKPALHEKINQAINSLKQQQSNTPTNNRNNNVDETNYPSNNNKQRKNEEMCPPALLDLTVKSLSNTTKQQKRIINKNIQEHKPIISSLHPTTMKSTADITIKPISASCSFSNQINNCSVSRQQKLNSHNNLISGFETPTTVYSSIEEHNTVSPLIVNMFRSNKKQRNRLPSNSIPTSSNTNSSQQQIIMTTFSTVNSTESQQNIKLKQQQNRKN